ncbi:MAG: hypothetical protein IJ759_07000 [Bacteroidales bacterium]|nr:hypothetical protein [Bacteroidales bacterium]
MKILNFRNLALCFTVVSTALVLNSCGVEGGLAGYDDIYADDEQIAFEEQNFTRTENKQVYQDPRYSHSPKQYREQINTEVVQDSVLSEDFDMDDYYDYAYTARLHRFHDPAPIYGYYDDYYTNLYWYDRDPLLWGTSIYYGYRWWWPSYSFAWGWGWSPWRHYGWYGDWWGWHHGWYGYDWAWGWYSGPHHGHWAHNPHYYNSHDRNSGFYRPEHEGGRLTRTNSSNNSTGARGNAGLSRNTSNQTFGDRYNQRFGNNNLTRGNATTLSRQGTTTNQNNVTRQTNRLQKPVTRTTNSTLSRGNASTQSNGSALNRGNNTTNRNNNLNNSPQRRSYTPPAQRQQRSSDSYRSNSSNRSTNMNRNSNNNMNRSRSLSTPSRSTATPSRNSSSSRSSSMSSSRSSSSSMGRSGGSSSRGGSSSHGGGRR